MGLDLTYTAGDREFAVRFSNTDWLTIGEVGKHLPEAVSVCFDAPDYGESESVPLTDLRDSFEQVDALLRDRPELLPHTYQFKPEYIGDGDKKIEFDRFSAGTAHGFRLPGDNDHWYAIRAGLNECCLEKWGMRPDGQGELIEERDLRGETELLTSNSGKVRFRKRLAKTSLRKTLAAIQDFLVKVEVPKVTKTIG